MPDQSNPDVMKATADLLGAASALVRAVSDPNATSTTSTARSLTLSTAQTLDSPAWLDPHHPDGSGGVHDLGEDYFDAHVPATKAADGKLLWDPSRGATWKDFARIGRSLFATDEAFMSDNTFRDPPFEGLRYLQQMLFFYDVENPAKLVHPGFPWPSVPGFPVLDTTWTIREAIARFLTVHNVDPATNATADRSKDFPGAPGGPLTLTHGQCVELRHILVTQEDVRLVAPYDILATMPW